MDGLAEILWRNHGQVLTPELIAGVLHAATPPPPETLDHSIAARLGPTPASYKGATFQIERLRDAFDEVSAQHLAQWDEVEPARTGFNPNYEYAFGAEDAGRYVLFTARRDNVLIGNVGCYLYNSLHTQKLAAKEDVLYLVPEERKGYLAVKFFRYCEDVLVNMLAVKEVTISVKTTNEVYRLWERQGYKFTDRVLTRTFE
jgi:hypothetical protein